MIQEELDTIRPKTWLSGTIMDYVLLHDWFQYRNQSSIYMVDVNISMALQETTMQVEEQITSFQN
jgi:hypothetical protein